MPRESGIVAVDPDLPVGAARADVSDHGEQFAGQFSLHCQAPGVDHGVFEGRVERIEADGMERARGSVAGLGEERVLKIHEQR